MHKNDPTLRLLQPQIHLSGANGSSLSLKGAIRFPLYLLTRISVTTDYIVCEHLSHDIIIGLDFLISTQALIDMHGKVFLFQSPDPPVPAELVYFVIMPTAEQYLTLF